MRVQLELSPEQVSKMAGAMIFEMEKQGKVVVAPERTRPWTVAEAAIDLNVSQRQVRTWVEAGMLERVPGTGKVLITAASLMAKQRGEI